MPLPDGDRPVDLWVDATGCLATEPVPDSEPLPGRYVVPGLVDAHAHPAVGREAGMPVALDGPEALNVLAAWAASGVCLVRDTGSPGGLVLQLDLVPGMPRLQAAGSLPTSPPTLSRNWCGRAWIPSSMARRSTNRRCG